MCCQAFCKGRYPVLWRGVSEPQSTHMQSSVPLPPPAMATHSALLLSQRMGDIKRIARRVGLLSDWYNPVSFPRHWWSVRRVEPTRVKKCSSYWTDSECSSHWRLYWWTWLYGCHYTHTHTHICFLSKASYTHTHTMCHPSVVLPKQYKQA